MKWKIHLIGKEKQQGRIMSTLKLKWKNLDSEARKWLRGWILVMCKDLSQKVVWHDQFDDTMLFYFSIPQSLTREQFEKTNAGKEIKVDWDNDRFIIDKKDRKKK